METKKELSKREVKARGLNPVFMHFEEEIRQGGKIVGYRQYANDGLFNKLRFSGYRWL